MAEEKLEDLILRVQSKFQKKMHELHEFSKEIDQDLEVAKGFQTNTGGALDSQVLLETVKTFQDAYTQVDLLTALIKAAASHMPRVILLILKGNVAHGWSGHGFSHDFVDGPLRQIKWEVNAYPELRQVVGDGAFLVQNFSDLSHISDSISAFDGFVPLKSCFMPIVVKGKTAAILYADSGSQPGLGDVPAVEIIARFVGLELTMIATKLKKPNPASEQPASTAPPAAATTQTVAPKREPAPPAAPKPAPKPTPAPAAGIGGAGADDDDPNRKKARRVARVLVSDLKLYNEAIVAKCLQSGNMYGALKEDIDRSFQHYKERVADLVPPNENFFKEELVKQLAEGRPEILGELPF